MVKVVRVNILSCGCFVWGAIGLKLLLTTKEQIVSSDSIFATKKKGYQKSDFQVAKSPSFSLTNPSSSSPSDQETVALRLAPVEREKLCVVRRMVNLSLMS